LGLFIETLHVPLLVKFPNSRYRGVEIGAHVRVMDVMPTLNELLRMEPLPMQGISFLPLLTGRGTYNPLTVSYAQPADISGRWSLRLMADGFVYSNQESGGRGEWLFDPFGDPLEQDELTVTQPEVLERMRLAAASRTAEDLSLKKALGFRATTGDVPEGSLAEELRALGYMQ
jgi:arylsulfatase A-like enzyme